MKIGGLKEKVLAAHRAHIETIIIPADNEPELEEIAKEVRDVVKFIPVRTLGEVVRLAFAPVAQPAAEKVEEVGAPSPLLPPKIRRAPGRRGTTRPISA